jgi:hypothetical protein
MNYYRLANSATASVVGTVPQVQELIYPSRRDSPNLVTNFFFRKSDGYTELPALKLAKKGKSTDFLSTVTAGRLCISNKMKEIIEQEEVYGIEFLEVDLVTKDSTSQYWLLNPFDPGYRFLDLQKSKFVIMADVPSRVPIKDVSFNDFNEVVEGFRNNDKSARENGIMHKPLMMSEIAVREDAEVDLFVLRGDLYTGIGFFVSDRLKQRLVNAGCTGVLYGPLNGPMPHVDSESL